MSGAYEHTFAPGHDATAHCVRCGGGQSYLPTCCPGKKMKVSTEARVYSGALDFDVGPGSDVPRWWESI